jgi:HEAT repeat protein
MNTVNDIDELLRHLSSADQETERDLVGQLTAAGPDAVDLLIPYLRHEDTTLCAMAAKAVGRMYPTPFCTSTAEALRGPSREDLAMLAACKRALTHLEDMAERGNVQLTIHACEAMLKIGDSDGLVAYWLAWALADVDVENRLCALEMLERLRKNAAPAVSALVTCLGAEEKDVTLQCAQVLGGLGKAAAEAIPILKTWITSEDQHLRAMGAHTIAKISKSTSVLPVLIAALENGDEYSRCYAALGCKPLGPLAAPAVPALMTVIEADMRDPDVESRHHAITALGDIGPGAAAAAGVLAKFLETLDADAEGWLLTDSSAACRSLAAMGPGAKAAVPALRNCLNWGPEDEAMLRWTRLEASEAIWRITGTTLPTLTVASEMLDDEMWRWKAIDLLAKLGSAALSAVPDLQRLLAHDDEVVRYDAERALERIRGKAEEK